MSVQTQIFKRVLVITLILGMAGFLATGRAMAEKPILIGAPLPLTGPYASDGEVMKMSLEMAVEEYNAGGGILGRKLKIMFGDVGALEPEKIKAVGERLIGAGVNFVITGYDDSGSDVKVFGQYDVPYLHGNTTILDTGPVAENLDKYWNIFQWTWNEIIYGVDAANHLFDIPKEMGWTPPNKKIALIRVDYAYNIIPGDEFAKRAKKMGYDVVVDEMTQFGVVEWGPILSKIESAEPAYITFWNLDPTDSARFMKQFVERFSYDGIDAIVYMQYTPAIPEFQALAGKAADGLIWAGIPDAPASPNYEKYKKRWVARYKKEPFGLFPAGLRDAFDIWARAVERAGCVECYREVCRQIRESTYKGMVATFVFNPIDQSALYGEYLLPLFWTQIQDGKHIMMAPKRFKSGKYQKPPWMKK